VFHNLLLLVGLLCVLVTLKGSDNFFEKRLFLEDFLLNRLNLCEGVGEGVGVQSFALIFLG